MNDSFPSMEEVVASMRGGGTSVSTRPRQFASLLISLLVERGWSRSIVTRMFRTLSDSHVGTHHLYGFADEWMKYKAAQSTTENPLEVLLEIGIRPSIVRLLDIRICTPLANTSYTDSQLVDASIEYLLEQRVPITAPDPLVHQTHPFRPDRIHTWFFHEEEGSSPTPFINIPFRCSSRKESRVQTLLDTLSIHNSDTHDLHFHTTSWGSIPPILHELHHTVGRTCLDFGLHPGFYMSQTLKDALDWGHALSGKFNHEVAILLFSLPKTLPPTLRVKHLENEEWTSVTQEARRCVKDRDRLREGQIPEIASIRRFDFLFGNMVANVNDVRYNNTLPSTHTPPKTQLTSKTRRGDMFLQEHILGCLFFQKYLPTATNRYSGTNRTRRSRSSYV
jgi:hypothetical protein